MKGARRNAEQVDFLADADDEVELGDTRESRLIALVEQSLEVAAGDEGRSVSALFRFIAESLQRHSRPQCGHESSALRRVGAGVVQIVFVLFVRVLLLRLRGHFGRRLGPRVRLAADDTLD